MKNIREKDDFAFVKHILESINAIEEFSEGINKDEFMSTRLKQSAIVREIEIIGEAVKNISEKIKKKYPEVEWKDIVGTRDKMIHHYFGVDLNIVWEIAKKDIPVLKVSIEKILENFKEKEII
jgi:uncharacterized protein with HEPN domain